VRTSLIQTVTSATLCCTLLALVACDNFPVLRSRADAQISAPSADGASTAEQCAHLRDQIRANQESSREAPAMSTSPQIVDAAQGKADQRIQELRDRMDSMNCAEQPRSDPNKPRISPLPPAPNAPNP
jgi:hypothetical protein